ncbi:hypothetical protein HUJ04_009185 [Dendroctonus ponderosae]|nr:hypothetical protein HUJ04_009185 [Dendroctonus ponderosae]
MTNTHGWNCKKPAILLRLLWKAARIATKYPSFFGAVIAVDKTGAIGAACNGMQKFTFSVMNTTTQGAALEYFVADFQVLLVQNQILFVKQIELLELLLSLFRHIEQILLLSQPKDLQVKMIGQPYHQHKSPIEPNHHLVVVAAAPKGDEARSQSHSLHTSDKTWILWLEPNPYRPKSRKSPIRAVSQTT